MSLVKVVLPDGEMATVTSDVYNEEQITTSILIRQKVAADYCLKMGWPTNPAELSFEQILEIRKQPEWINAAK